MIKDIKGLEVIYGSGGKRRNRNGETKCISEWKETNIGDIWKKVLLFDE